MNKSQLTKVIKVMVVSLLDIAFPSISLANTESVNITISAALEIARRRRAFVNKGSVDFRGFALRILSSTGSTPKDWAGGPSIMI